MIIIVIILFSFASDILTFFKSIWFCSHFFILRHFQVQQNYVPKMVPFLNVSYNLNQSTQLSDTLTQIIRLDKLPISEIWRCLIEKQKSYKRLFGFRFFCVSRYVSISLFFMLTFVFLFFKMWLHFPNAFQPRSVHIFCLCHIIIIVWTTISTANSRLEP